MMAPFVRFSEGMVVVFRGMGLILGSRALKVYTLIPFLLAILMIFFGFAWAFQNLTGYVYGLIAWLGLSTQNLWLIYVGMILAWPAFVLALFFTVFLLLKVVAAPFHSLLAERALIEQGMIRDEPFRFGRWLRVSARMLLVSLVKAVFFGVIGVALFACSFIPGLNLVAAFGFFLIVAFDVVDYSLEVLQYGFRKRLGFFRANFAHFSGLAVALSVLFMVPGLNFFLFPAAVAGGAEMVRKIRDRAGG